MPYGVGEHTDYGLLTLLRQDDVGGLTVRTRDGWVDAPPVPESFVCNIGDMLDRATGGYYRSTPHRVRLNASGRDRLSFPLFLDPDFDARIEPIRPPEHDDRETRWDGATGAAGFFERLFAPPSLRRIYNDELRRLDRYAREQVGQREPVGSR